MVKTQIKNIAKKINNNEIISFIDYNNNKYKIIGVNEKDWRILTFLNDIYFTREFHITPETEVYFTIE